MAAFTLSPTSVGTYDAWALSGAPDKVTAVTDSSDASDIRTAPAVVRQSFVISDLPSEADFIIGNVVGNSRAKDVTATTDKVLAMFRYSSTNYDAPSGGWDFSASFANYTENYATLGGTPWTPAILNACEYGVSRASAGAFTIIVSELSVTGEYGVGGGGFAFLVMSLIGGLLGANLLMSDMPGIAREVSMTHRPGEAYTLFRPHEYAELYQDLKNFRHPVRFDLGNHE